MKLIYSLLLLLGTSAMALDGVYVGGELGQISLTGTTKSVYNNAIGFGLDVGFRINPTLDVMFQSQMSSHSGLAPNLKIYSQTLGANLHFGMSDFDFTLGMGPGFYTYDSGVSETHFGIHGDVGADVVVSDGMRVGLGLRYHSLLGATGMDDYWSLMMRVGYIFGMN